MADTKDILTIQQTNSDGIQRALNKVGEGQAYDALRLLDGAYNINKPLLLNSETEIFGSRYVTLKLMSNASPTVFKVLTPIFGQKGKDIHDVSIHGFCFDGNSTKQSVLHGKGFHNFIYFQNGSDITVRNMILKNSQGDGARFKACERIDMCGCKIDRIGHDAGYFLNCDTVNYFANTVNLRTNSGIRTANTNHVKIFDNLIMGSDNWWAGNPGCQIDHNDFTVVDDLEIYGNVFKDTYGAGIWLDNYGEASRDLSLCKDYQIHDNLFVGCGLNPSIDYVGGLQWSGVDNVQFDHNTVVDSYRYGVAGHVGTPVWSTRPKGKGYTATVSNCIITGTKLGRFSNGVGNGYGIGLTMFSTHHIESENNCIWDNAGGNYLNVKSSTDSYEPVELDENYYPVTEVDCGCRRNT